MLSSDTSTSSKTWNDWTDKIRFSTCVSPWKTKFLREAVAQKQPTVLQAWRAASPTTRHKSCRTWDSWGPRAHWEHWCYIFRTSLPSAATPCPQNPWCGVESIGRAAQGRGECDPHTPGGWQAEAQQCQEGWVCGYVARPRPRKSVSPMTFLLCWMQDLSCGCEAPRAGGSLVLCWWGLDSWDPWGSTQAHGQRTVTIWSLCHSQVRQKKDGLEKLRAKLENISGGLVTVDQRCPSQKGKALEHVLVMDTISSYTESLETFFHIIPCKKRSSGKPDLEGRAQHRSWGKVCAVGGHLPN